MKIALVRGAYFNKYEMQTYEPLIPEFDFTGFSSLRPIHDKFSFPLIKLTSPMDLPNFPYKMPILNRFFGDTQVLFGLENKLAGYDIAHSAETYFYFTQQCLNAKSQGLVKKVVSTVWENIPFNNEGIRLRKKFKKRAIQEVDHFICVTNQAKEALIKEGCDDKKISVIYPGINLKNFQFSILRQAQDKIFNFQKYKQIPDKQIKILFVGRLEIEKGIWDLLEAFKDLTFNPPCGEAGIKHLTLKLKIIGEGSQKHKIDKFIRNNNLKNRVVIKKINYEYMPKEYQESDIFVLPSKRTKYWQEQFGMVLIEAMASGLAIVASKSGAIPEVVGEAGILVAEGNNADLIKGIRAVVDNNDLRMNLREKGRERVEKLFDAKKQAKIISEIYRSLIK